MEWLQANWLPLVIVILLCLAFIGYIAYLCKKKGLKKVALEAILFAEDKYNSTTGQERLQIAIDFVYNSLPEKIKLLLPKSLLEKFIENLVQKTFDEVKKALDYQKLTAIKEEN